MNQFFYYGMHFIGLVFMAVALGGIGAYVMGGGKKESFKLRKLYGILHGVGSLFVLVAGFGLMAKIGYKFGNSYWIWGKFAIWLALGFYPAVFYGKFKNKALLFWGMIALFVVAILLVINRFYLM